MKPLLFTNAEPTSYGLDRIQALRRKMEKREARICSQRALFYTVSFRQTQGEPYILRKAKAFAYTLEHMDIYLEDDSLIFGNQSSRNFAAPIFPEYSFQWVIDELDQFEKRSGDVFQIDEKCKQELRDLAPFWIGNTHEDQVAATSSRDILLAEKQGVIHRGGISMSGDGHIVPDHEMILKRGFLAIIEDAKEALAVPKLQQDKSDFYTSVIIVLQGALLFFKRYATLARELAKKEEHIQRKRELQRIAEMAEHMMEGPAHSFYEGCEVCYMVHVLQMIESNGHSFCYGRFDQYMWELYERDQASGLITQEQALEIITHLFIMNSSLNKVRPYGHTKYSQGYPLYSNLVVGGLKPNGIDGTNELSYLCIEAMNLTALAEPNFSVRYHRHSPKKFVKAAALLIRTGCGMPSMFNDEVVAQGIEELGIPKADALDYCPIGCVETGVPGKYGHRATGMTYVNWGKLVELLLHNGVDPNSGIQMISINKEANDAITYHSYDEVWQAWKNLLKFYSDIAVACDQVCDASLSKYDADPFASCLIDNAMKLGKTLKKGGCKYDVISQSNIGPVVVGNSLAVIKRLIFDEQKITMSELMNAIHDNWESKESRSVHKLVRNVPKFGNDEDEVDTIVKDVFDSYLALLPQYRSDRYDQGPEVSCYTMSTSNITSYVPNGFAVGATPDGRYAKSPLNEGCSPTQGTDVKGPTALINSVSKLPNAKVAAGQLLNMRFTPEILEGEENLQRFVDFLMTSVKKGIYHNQFNIIDTKILEDAMQQPDQYTNLIVRVAGYCAQFVSLMPETQNAIIARSQNSWS